MTSPPRGSTPWPPEPARPGQRSDRQIEALMGIRGARQAAWRRIIRVAVGAVVIAGVVAASAAVVTTVVPKAPGAPRNPEAPYGYHHVIVKLPAHPDSYLGAYATGVPGSYAPIEAFSKTTGIQQNIALYYSGWWEPFKTAFAADAAHFGAIPLIQMDPNHYSLTAIAAGRYDSYLSKFANAVARYGSQTGHGVIIGFGHEPNGDWYPWGRGHVSPAIWVAAWRHVVDVFRQEGADNVTWLWTVNIIDERHGHIPAPDPWWPGSSYVTWVGIDGYYLRPSWTFASLFGPTIKAVRALTLDPILISETGAAPVANKPAKIADLFAGSRAYGLLGFVWFNANRTRDWRLSAPAAVAAYRRGAKTFKRAEQ